MKPSEFILDAHGIHAWYGSSHVLHGIDLQIGRGVFPNLSVRENLVMAARRGRDGRNDWSYERVLDTFPRIKDAFEQPGCAAFGRRAANAVDWPGADDAPGVDHP